MKTRDWSDFIMGFGRYEMYTSFGNDFDEADEIGMDAIKETFERSFGECDDVKKAVELTLVCMWKTYEHAFGDATPEIADLYSEFWDKAQAHARSFDSEDDADYYCSHMFDASWFAYLQNKYRIYTHEELHERFSEILEAERNERLNANK